MPGFACLSWPGFACVALPGFALPAVPCPALPGFAPTGLASWRSCSSAWFGFGFGATFLRNDGIESKRDPSITFYVRFCCRLSLRANNAMVSLPFDVRSMNRTRETDPAYTLQRGVVSSSPVPFFPPHAYDFLVCSFFSSCLVFRLRAVGWFLVVHGAQVVIVCQDGATFVLPRVSLWYLISSRILSFSSFVFSLPSSLNPQ